MVDALHAAACRRVNRGGQGFQGRASGPSPGAIVGAREPCSMGVPRGSAEGSPLRRQSRRQKPAARGRLRGIDGMAGRERRQAPFPVGVAGVKPLLALRRRFSRRSSEDHAARAMAGGSNGGATPPLQDKPEAVRGVTAHILRAGISGEVLRCGGWRKRWNR